MGGTILVLVVLGSTRRSEEWPRKDKEDDGYLQPGERGSEINSSV